MALCCGHTLFAGYNDSRRFPDFRYISREGNFKGLIDLVIISHFHLDHCGSLPYFTEVLGYDGPLYATHPTKAIMPILLEDYRKISVERRGVEQKDFFTSEQIKQCMLKVTPCALEETVSRSAGNNLQGYPSAYFPKPSCTRTAWSCSRRRGLMLEPEVWMADALQYGCDLASRRALGKV